MDPNYLDFTKRAVDRNGTPKVFIRLDMYEPNMTHVLPQSIHEFVGTSGRRRQLVECLVYNLVRSHTLTGVHGRHTPIITPLSRETLRTTYLGASDIPIGPFREGIRQFEEAGLLEVHIGAKELKRASTISPTSRFVGLINKVSVESLVPVEERVRGKVKMKDEDKATRVVPVLDSKGTQRNLDTINRNVRRHIYTVPSSIEGDNFYPNNPIPYRRAKYRVGGSQMGGLRTAINDLQMRYDRVFSMTLKKGGRFYNLLTKYKKDARRTLEINGEPTVEVDFKGCHVRLAYDLVKQRCPTDPYVLGGYARDLVKYAMVIMLNCASKRKVYGAIRQAWLEKKKETLQISVKALYNAILVHHSPIAEFLRGGEGLRLQYVESRVAERVLLHFAVRKKPCLCVHDSFIVVKRDQNMLENAMIANYLSVLKHETGATPGTPILDATHDR